MSVCAYVGVDVQSACVNVPECVCKCLSASAGARVYANRVSLLRRIKIVSMRVCLCVC